MARSGRATTEPHAYRLQLRKTREIQQNGCATAATTAPTTHNEAANYNINNTILNRYFTQTNSAIGAPFSQNGPDSHTKQIENTDIFAFISITIDNLIGMNHCALDLWRLDSPSFGKPPIAFLSHSLDFCRVQPSKSCASIIVFTALRIPLKHFVKCNKCRKFRNIYYRSCTGHIRHMMHSSANLDTNVERNSCADSGVSENVPRHNVNRCGPLIPFIFYV